VNTESSLSRHIGSVELASNEASSCIVAEEQAVELERLKKAIAVLEQDLKEQT
jgi:hypothetical protein